jgi:hypothetical protein
MIFAELHGKLGSDGSRAHDRLEDLLTSTAFGLLRYVPLRVGLLGLLRRVRVVEVRGSSACASRNPGWIDLDDAVTVEVVFWPSFGKYGQPDVLLHLMDVNRALIGVVLVEAKLYAPKSGAAGADADEVADDEVPDPDQLVKYWQGLQQHVRLRGSCPAWLVYLTAHSSPPVVELGEAMRRLRYMRLGWLSWFDVFDVAAACDDLPAKDLAALLSRKGFRGFSGFTEGAVELPLTRGFWRPARTTAEPSSGLARQWFSEMNPPLEMRGARFWNAT